MSRPPLVILFGTALSAVALAQVSPFQLNITSSNALQNGVLMTVEETQPFVYTVTNFVISDSWRNIAPGSNSFVVNLATPNPARSPAYVFMARYSGGVSLTLTQNAANFVTVPGSGRSWNTFFSQDPEPLIAQNLLDMYDPNNAPAAFDVLGQFGRRYGIRWAPIDAQAPLVSFSEPTITGSSSLQPVPEPGTLTALGLGALALLRRKRSA